MEIKTDFKLTIYSIGLFLGILSLSLHAAILNAEQPKTSLTIYSSIPPGQNFQNLYKVNDPNAISGYGIVRQIQNIELKQGYNQVTLNNIANYIDPTTFSFKSLTDPLGSQLVEQNFRYDVMNTQKLIEKYLGKEVTVEQNVSDKIETYSGKLLGGEGGVILQDANGTILNISQYSMIRFPGSNLEFMTKPTLFLTVTSNKPGINQVETSYQTQGISWWVDYSAVLTETQDNKGLLSLGAWVSIINKTGLDYANANLKLIAGEVNRANAYMGIGGVRSMAMKMADNVTTTARGFSETPFFEYHLYTLGREIDLPDNSIKQVELFPKISNIPTEILYVFQGPEITPYYGQPNLNKDPGFQSNTTVDTYVKFTNGKKEGLGIPLPAGRIRISKAPLNKGTEEFIGESNIDHTPVNEELRLKLGTAFDIVGERKQVSFSVDENRKFMDESFEITIKNRKANDVVVAVKEVLYRGINWKISAASDKYDMKNASTVEFLLPVKKGSESTLKYTVRYTW